jgi:nucleoside-diphosphate-sugar epimerase
MVPGAADARRHAVNWSELSILVTGGTGSFGRKFVELVLRELRPKKLIVFSRDELKQHEMRQQFPDTGDSPVRYFLGDVRDRERLYRAFYGVDVIVHAAALKQVPACEYNPFEAILTNVMGAKNVIDAAIDCGVKRVMALSTDKACVDWHSRVQLADGRTRPISAIVREQQRVSVSTVDGERLAESSVVGWFKNRRAGRAMLHLSYDGAAGRAGHETGVWLTVDHPVLTASGWKKAGDVAEGELLVTGESAPNPQQLAMLAGTLLGDSGLYRNKAKGSRWRLQMGHAADALEWLRLKASALQGMPISPVQTDPARPSRQAFVSVHSRTMACLRPIAERFYGVSGRKRVPRAVIESTFPSAPAVFLAAWFLDDGCYAKPHGSKRGLARLATHGFSRTDVGWLARFLSARGLESRAVAVTADGKQYWELRFTAEGSQRLFGLIAPGIPPTMRHKLPPDILTSYDPAFWNLGTAVRFRAPARLLPGKPPGPRDVYCIAVERTENFIVNGLVLHNCQPVNLYGATKLCAEKLFVDGNQYAGSRDTRFACARYGNVVASRGSVIPVFLEQRRNGRITITDPAMSRFWITLEQGVRFVLRCIEEMHGGEIFVPKIPSMTILELSRTVAPDCEVDVIGIRPGEKTHEILVSEDEARHTLELDDKFVILPPGRESAAQRWSGSRPLSPGFRYASDTNPQQLSPRTLTELLGPLA